MWIELDWIGSEDACIHCGRGRKGGSDGRVDQSYGFVRHVNRCPVGCVCLSWMIDFLLLLLFLSAVERRTDMVCMHSAGLKPEGIATLIVRSILGVQTD